MSQKIVVSMLFSSFILFSACGGGNSSNAVGTDSDSGNGNGNGNGNDNGSGTNVGGGEQNALFKFQTSGLERIEYDYDNNGIAEGVETFTYDDSGRLAQSTYLYTADGTADLPTKFGNPNIGFMTVDITYTYDDLGRVVSTNNIAESNNSLDSSLSLPSRTIDFTFEYQDESEYPISITENYLDENDIPLYRYTDMLTYDENDALESFVREYDPSISANAINNPGYLAHGVYEYSETIDSIQQLNYLDEFMVASIFTFSEDGLISSLIVTSDASMSLSPPPLTAIVEYFYNDRGCLVNFNSGLYDDVGTIEYKRSMELTYGEQDRITLRELDEDFDGTFDSSESYVYGDIDNTTRPFSAVEFGYPTFYLQGRQTSCLSD